jgi:hypothetical protein
MLKHMQMIRNIYMFNYELTYVEYLYHWRGCDHYLQVTAV